jgi:hypothetical protein
VNKVLVFEMWWGKHVTGSIWGLYLPGTTVAALQVSHFPFLFTVARGLRLAFRAATASPALIVSYLEMRMRISSRFTSEP